VIAQAVVLLAFVFVGIAAVRRFRPLAASSIDAVSPARA
jgi:hypothetical protein